MYHVLGGWTHYLDRKVVELDGLRLGGLSGVVGDPRKPLRRSDEEFVEWIERLLDDGAEILVLHDGPEIPDRRLRGQASIRGALERARPTLVLRGHCHWNEAVARLANGTQIVNAHEKVVVLERAASDE